MRPPCEIVVNLVLPTIRAMLVKDLVERHKLSQVEVARRLDITQPAVSQYLSALRGKSTVQKILSKGEVAESLKELSNAIARGKLKHSQIIKKYCVICKSMGKKEILCILHAETAPYLVREGCRICLRGSRH